MWYRFNLLAPAGYTAKFPSTGFSVGSTNHIFLFVYRYQWNNTPLLITDKTLPAPSGCQHCGAPRVFELQLMPPLVYLLRTSSGVDVEFGTVLVYTCSKSCWQVGSSAREEYVYVQYEPEDSQLVKWTS